MYRVITEIGGDEIFKGELEECKKIIEAFAKYGIPERKFIIEYPKHHGFQLSDRLKESIVRDLVQARYDGINYSDFVWEYAEDEITSLSDYGLINELEFYEEVVEPEYEEDEHGEFNTFLRQAKNEYNNFIVDKELLGDE
jgi:hypothetical protein